MEQIQEDFAIFLILDVTIPAPPLRKNSSRDNCCILFEHLAQKLLSNFFYFNELMLPFWYPPLKNDTFKFKIEICTSTFWLM